MPKFQHNLTPLNSRIKVTHTWPFCMNPEVDSYRTGTHNLTNAETTYNIKLNMWFLLMGIIYNTSEYLSVIPCFPNIYTVGTRPSVDPLYKYPSQTMAQMYQLNIKWLDTDIMALSNNSKNQSRENKKLSSWLPLQKLKLNKNWRGHDVLHQSYQTKLKA